MRGHPAWERGLLTRPTLPLVRKSGVETFRWHIKPSELPVVGTVFPDGSCRDGPAPELMRCGWALVIFDEAGNIAAAAYGVLLRGSTTLEVLKPGPSFNHCCAPYRSNASIGPTAIRLRWLSASGRSLPETQETPSLASTAC